MLHLKKSRRIQTLRLLKLKATREKTKNYIEEKQYNPTEKEFQYYNFLCILHIPLYIMFQ